MLVEIVGGGGPMCPNGMEPIHPAHALRVRITDAFYNAAEKDADGEMPPELEAAYTAATYGPGTGDRMRLYMESAAPANGPRRVVEAWWFQCVLCGLVLPAVARG